jgi:hypothetical protein
MKTAAIAPPANGPTTGTQEYAQSEPPFPGIGLVDEPRCGAPRKIDDERIEAIIAKTLEEKPANATHWSTRSMAKALGVSTTTVHRIWRAAATEARFSSLARFVEPVFPLTRQGAPRRRFWR